MVRRPSMNGRRNWGIARSCIPSQDAAMPPTWMPTTSPTKNSISSKKKPPTSSIANLCPKKSPYNILKIKPMQSTPKASAPATGASPAVSSCPPTKAPSEPYGCLMQANANSNAWEGWKMVLDLVRNTFINLRDLKDLRDLKIQ